MPWPANTRHFGKATPRAEGPAKAAGRAKYTSDIALPGMLFGAIVRSTWPAAHISAVNLEKVRAAPGIKAAVPAQDGEFEVRYYGAEIAAIAGVSRQAVRDALHLVEIKAEPLPFVVHEIDAIKADAVRVFKDRPNLGEGKERTTGDAAAAFAAAAAVVEGTIHTQVEFHQPLESHGHTVSWDGDEMTA